MKLLDGDLAGAEELVLQPSLRAWAAHDSPARVPTAMAASERDFSAMLLAMAGHDLRQPLQVLTTAHDVLAAILENDSQREALMRAEVAQARLATMLRQIVEALQLREAARDCRTQPVSLGPILDDLVVEFARPARSKEISFAVVPSQAKVSSQPILLLGILRNLVCNAINYTPRGGRVLVACGRHGSELCIEVHDSGAGIHPDALPRMLAAFQRSDSTRADGLGLGLFIVKTAADFLGHRIHIHSAVGRGSCFGVVAKCDDLSRRQTPERPSAGVVANHAYSSPA